MIGRSISLAILLLGSAALVCAQKPQAPESSKNPHGPLKMACESCHTTLSWKPIRVKPEFDHNTETSFPLRGLHEGVQCSQCHTNPVFSKVGKLCADCHADIHAGKMGAACQDCHTVRGWRVSVADVTNHFNRFPLLGAHAAVPCDSCHKGAATGVFYGLSTSCASCHLTDFQKTTAPSHVAANLPLACDSCHSVDHWQGAKFDHAAFTSFPLLGAHASLDCSACHLNGRFAGTPVDCYGCHATDYNGAQNPNHVAAGFPHDCLLCHSFTTWQGATFNHNMTPFPLTGAHASVQCSACHTGANFAATPTACSGCHLPDFQKTTNPSHVQSGFPTTCDTCHTTTSWQGAKFDHNSTKFPLTGAHASVSCSQCHVNGQFAGTPTDCGSCHLTDFKGTTNPNHVLAGFSTDCSSCHTTVQWKGATFDHSKTKFPLTGMHTAATCIQCHVSGPYSATSTDCYSCHSKDYNSATNPNHPAAGFPTNCSFCHTTAQWQGATFDHSKTAFPLTGAHTTVQCSLCHTGGNFTSIPTDCASCHMTDFKATTNPNHVAAAFPTNCSFCHTTANWQGAQFDHSKTGFALTGAHATVQCSQCHVGGKYAGTPTDCASCHLTDFNKTSNPPHVQAGFPTSCTLCHTTTAWQPANFDHSMGPFPLTGAHTTVQCKQCHTNNNFTTVPTDCFSCHQADYNGTSNPAHKAAGLPTNCTLCHSTTSWAGAVFDHNKTGFALTGAHTPLQCAQCHVANNYNLTSGACANCHLNDYNGTTSPAHKAAGFPQDCTLCHTTTSWAGAVFDHSKTGFALTGAHAPLQCAQCHVGNNYNLTSGACANCHLNDYNGTTNPAHQAAGFPQDCTLCHTTTSWAGATFDHNKTGFALTGAHATVQCASCHVSNNYNLTSGACSNCHLNDYNGTTSPAHKAAGFPQDCTLCHTTTSWAGATFDHSKTGFALTGAHAPLQCAQCHVGNNYSLTSGACANCHMTDYNDTTNPNHKAAGFPTTCDTCHSTTNWAGATFDHSKTGFALTGAHTNVQCASCHVNGNFSLTSGACANCHIADYNGTNNPAHKAAGFPTTCDTCHTTTSWAGATFNHTTTGFALTGAHTSLQCSQCHVNGNFSLNSAACADCHIADYNGTTNPSHKSAGFPTTCDSCHTTTSWAGATFDHSKTGFPLTGAHSSVQCASCHVNGNYNLTSGACVNCHLTDYNNTTSPAHKAAGFPQDCTLCHTTTSWAGATFDHSSTGFALTGAHTTLQCAQCHTNNNYGLTSGACANCHIADYNGTTNPAHKAAGFPTTCDTCHSTTSWAGATFNHNNTPFPLTGAHTTVACASCHVNNVFAGTPTDCYSCHAADYNGTTNPNHKSAGFPTTCATCHTTTAWTGATFNHTWFPTNHGNANGVCSTCHTNSSDYSVFQCTGCHAQAQTTNQHQGVKGFVWSSPSCYSCHPNGRGG